MERIECKISGRVQLVMFRDFAQRKARRSNIVGEVKNLKDRSVFVVAEGSRDTLEKYLKFLKKGSLLSRVDNVSVERKVATGEFTNFMISY